jgi:hypothetical protein
MNKNAATAFIEREINNPPSGSPLGFHFISAYNENKWEWFLRYVRALVPIHTPTALIYGGAIHSAFEYVYTHTDVDGMVLVFKKLLQSRRDEYSDTEAYEKDLKRGPQELVFWANSWLDYDLTNYDLLGVELPIEAPLVDPLKMTMRLDLVKRDKETGDVLIVDHKTTGWSVSGTVSSMDVQDQATAYLYGLQQVHPKWYSRCLGLEPDILYHRGNSMKAERPTILTRTRDDLARFRLEMQGLMVEMAQKVQAYVEGRYHPYQLFPRNGKDAGMFGRVDYADLQRGPLPKDPRQAPAGYRVDHELLENVLEPFMEGVTTWEEAHATG